MNRNRLVSAVLTSVLALGAFAPAAFADDWERDRRGPGHHGDHRREWRHDRHVERREWRRDRHIYSNGYREGYRDAYRRDRYYQPSGYGYYRPAPPPRPYWARGQRYHGPVYVINDYDRYHLRRPPYGYRWQRDDRGNLLLVAIATGIIADLVLNN
ncbi:RcnB family protein [Xanthomonas maliensis]|uniref:RcnB family protein n=1 Tax=Xanthomonas maliensis TaxID=1321368 RepID=UPI0003A6AE82|nr:RcnB family protein [Xanthomonas maliensis]KAB7765479.1 hypothetical protein CKY51_15295 [Xanthomonas maliensis]